MTFWILLTYMHVLLAVAILFVFRMFRAAESPFSGINAEVDVSADIQAREPLFDISRIFELANDPKVDALACESMERFNETGLADPQLDRWTFLQPREFSRVKEEHYPTERDERISRLYYLLILCILTSRSKEVAQLGIHIGLAPTHDVDLFTYADIAESIRTLRAQREASRGRNGNKPAPLISAMPRSSSSYVSSILSSVLDFPIGRVTIGMNPNRILCETALIDFAAGNCVSHDHLKASPELVGALRRAGIKRIAFQYRDPRETAWSSIQQLHDANANADYIAILRQELQWMTEWLSLIDSGTPFEILLVDYNEVRTNPFAVFSRLLDWFDCGEHRERLIEVLLDATSDLSRFNFKSGDSNNWHRGLSDDAIATANDLIPTRVSAFLDRRYQPGGALNFIPAMTGNSGDDIPSPYIPPPWPHGGGHSSNAVAHVECMLSTWKSGQLPQTLSDLAAAAPRELLHFPGSFRACLEAHCLEPLERLTRFRGDGGGIDYEEAARLIDAVLEGSADAILNARPSNDPPDTTDDNAIERFVESVNQDAGDTMTIVILGWEMPPSTKAIAQILKDDGHRVFFLQTSRLGKRDEGRLETLLDGVLSNVSDMTVLDGLLTRLHPDVFHIISSSGQFRFADYVLGIRGMERVVLEVFDTLECSPERARGNVPDWYERAWLELRMEQRALQLADSLILHPSIEGLDATSTFPLTDKTTLVWRHAERTDIPLEPSVPEGRNNEPPRLLYVGAPPSNPLLANGTSEIFAAQVECWRGLAEQGFHIDIYLQQADYDAWPDRPSLDHLREEFGETVQLFLDFPFEAASGVVRHYDFGSTLTDFVRSGMDPRHPHLDAYVAPAIPIFLRHGLPVLVNAEYRQAARLVEQKGFGIAIPAEMMSETATIVRTANRAGMEGRLASSGNEFSPASLAPAIVDLFRNAPIPPAR